MMNWKDVFNQDNFSVFDFETSGLDESLDHIIEVGLLEVRSDLPGATISWVVNPNFPDAFHIATEVTMINRIRWLPVWGHNIVRFDCAFIDEECRRMCTIPPPKSSWFDTAAAFKAWRLSLPDQKWTQEPNILTQIEEYDTFYDYGTYILNKPIKGLYYNLPYCCETLGVDTSDIKFHRAGGDVMATHRVREALKPLILG